MMIIIIMMIIMIMIILMMMMMYQDIAVARGHTYDTLNVRMDKCQQKIETMGDDIQRLQANLADEEMQLEEDRIDELTRREDWERARAEIRARRAEEERRTAEERRWGAKHFDFPLM